MFADVFCNRTKDGKKAIHERREQQCFVGKTAGEIKFVQFIRRASGASYIWFHYNTHNPDPTKEKTTKSISWLIKVEEILIENRNFFPINKFSEFPGQPWKLFLINNATEKISWRRHTFGHSKAMLPREKISTPIAKTLRKQLHQRGGPIAKEKSQMQIAARKK